jgi:DNA-binding transcriptional ArsR family regulator
MITSSATEEGKRAKSIFNDIERYIKRASSTVSWHLTRLREAGIISMGHQMYRLKNRALVISLMNKIKS